MGFLGFSVEPESARPIFQILISEPHVSLSSSFESSNPNVEFQPRQLVFQDAEMWMQFKHFIHKERATLSPNSCRYTETPKASGHHIAGATEILTPVGVSEIISNFNWHPKSGSDLR